MPGYYIWCLADPDAEVQSGSASLKAVERTICAAAQSCGEGDSESRLYLIERVLLVLLLQTILTPFVFPGKEYEVLFNRFAE
jgi:hypothetical protein